MNWDNKDNQDPWGRRNNDGPNFDDLMKQFSSILGRKKKGSSNGSGGSA